MIEDIRPLYKEFTKDELRAIAGELGLKDYDQLTTRGLVELILKDFKDNGDPKPASASDALIEFMYVAGIVDEKGNFIVEVKPEVKDEQTKTDVIPPCYGFQDDRDPACNMCKLVEKCKQARIDGRPECYGISYDEHAAECTVCIEAPYCKIATIANQTNIKQQKGKV